MFLHPEPPPAAPSGVMVVGVDDTSVRVSWQPVDDAVRYTVTFTKTRGNEQEGVCRDAHHMVQVSINAPHTSASIGVGQMLNEDDTTMLRAYTTYAITMVAVNDAGGRSEASEPITATTAQIGKMLVF